jgi:spermidine synthase
LIAGFYLLRLYDVNIATFAAVALNLGVAAASFLLAARTPTRLSMEDDAPPETVAPAVIDPGFGWTIYVTIALSGASALGAEVVWTRLMGLMLGATVYVFSLILAVFLVGLAIGTAAASATVRGINPRLALGWCQLLAAAGIAWTASAIAGQLPYWPINPQLATNPVFIFQVDLVRVIWAILPATLFWGASFPFAFAASAARDHDSGAIVGGIYAANTAGAIVGALMVSLVLIPAIGTQNTQRVLLILAALGGLAVLIPLMRHARTQTLELSAGVAVGLVALLVWGVHKVPDELIAFGRRMATTTGMAKILYTAEGRNTYRHLAMERWRAAIPRRGQGRGLDRNLRHEAAAHARPSAGADPSQPALGAGGGIRRRRHRRHLHHLSGRATHRHLRVGAAHPAGFDTLFRQRELRRDER